MVSYILPASEASLVSQSLGCVVVIRSEARPSGEKTWIVRRSSFRDIFTLNFGFDYEDHYFL